MGQKTECLLDTVVIHFFQCAPVSSLIRLQDNGLAISPERLRLSDLALGDYIYQSGAALSPLDMQTKGPQTLNAKMLRENLN